MNYQMCNVEDDTCAHAYQLEVVDNFDIKKQKG